MAPAVAGSARVVVVATVSPAASVAVVVVEEGAHFGETAAAETAAAVGEEIAVGNGDEETVVHADEEIVAAVEVEGLVGIEGAEIAVAAGYGATAGEIAGEETVAAPADGELVGIVDEEIVASEIEAVATESEAAEAELTGEGG